MCTRVKRVAKGQEKTRKVGRQKLQNHQKTLKSVYSDTTYLR